MWTRQRALECLNKFCQGDILPSYDWRQSELLKFNGTWYLGTKSLYSSGTNGASFLWPPGPADSTKRRIEIFLNGRGSWLIPADPSTPRPPIKSSLDQAREAGDPIDFATIRSGLDRYHVQHRTSYGPQTFTVYVATDRTRVSGVGNPTLVCRSVSCTSGDFLQPDLYADYRVEEVDAADWPEIHFEIVRILGLLSPIGKDATVDHRPEVCKPTVIKN